MRHAICYVSTAIPELPEDQVQEILDMTEKNNNQEKITGILLFSEGNFFQVLEGKKNPSQNYMKKLKKMTGTTTSLKYYTKKLVKQNLIPTSAASPLLIQGTDMKT